jgi:CHAT domain-containing protein
MRASRIACLAVLISAIALATVAPSASAKGLPDKCDELPRNFDPLPRQPLEPAHREVLAVLAMPSERSKRAAAVLPTMRGILDRVVQRHGHSSPEAAIARYDLATLLSGAPTGNLSPVQRQARQRQIATELREAVQTLLRSAVSPAHVDFAAYFVAEARLIGSEDPAERQRLLLDVLNRHRRAFGEIARQWPLWTKTIDAHENSPTAHRLRRERIAAADRMGPARAGFEARAALMERLYEQADSPAEMIALARRLTPELSARSSRDIAHGKFDRGCRWVSPAHTRTHLKIILSQGTEEEKAKQLGIAIRHQGFAVDFGTDMAGAVLNAMPVIEARYADVDAYRDALTIVGTQDLGDPRKGTAHASYAARTIASAYASVSAHGTAITLYEDALAFVKGKEEEDLDYTLALLLELAEIEWRYGTSANTENVLGRADELVKRHPTRFAEATMATFRRLEAEVADARLDDSRAGALFAAIVELAMSRRRTGPDGEVLEDGSAAHTAATGLVERHLRRRFCTGCGVPVAEPAIRWLKRFEARPPLSGEPDRSSILSPSEFLLLRLLPPDRMPDASWKAAIADLSLADAARGKWNEWSKLATQRLGTRANARAVAQIIALYLASGGGHNNLTSGEGQNRQLSNFLSFLLERDLVHKRKLWKEYFDPIAAYSYQQFGAETDLYEHLDGWARGLINAGYTLAGRIVLESLLERIDEHSGSADAAANIERRRIDFAPLLVSVHARLAALMREAGEPQQAKRRLDEGARLARLRLTREWRAGNERAGAVLRDLKPALRLIAQLRAKMAADPATGRPVQDGASEAFEDLQLAMLGDTTMSSQAAQRRRMMGASELAAAIKSRDAAISTVETLDLFRRTAGVLIPARMEQVRAAALADLHQAESVIQAKLPASEDLASLTPTRLTQAQRLLDPDEALLVLHAGTDAVYGLMVPNAGDSLIWVSRLPENDLKQRIAKLRDGVDARNGTLPRFPFEVAVELFDHLLGPARAALATHSRLLVVVDGPLQSLPIGILLADRPAAAPTNAQEFRAAKPGWLARTHAITQLVNIKALESRSQTRLASQANLPFAGIGNPKLTGESGAARSVDYAGLFGRGALADVDAIRALPALPETESELRMLAATFGATVGDLLLGEQATENAVKQRSFSNYRIVAFATHALVGGEAGWISEPGLVLTPPPRADENDDGLLTASEVAGLKLDAELVILSACNTAASDGRPRAEGLSGLARAFIIAGARSLLVTHWSIPSSPAVHITTRMVAARAAEPRLEWAQALQRAIIHLIDDHAVPSFAHPANWGAFAIVGASPNR